MTREDIEQDDQQFFELWLAHKSVDSPTFVTGSHSYWAWQGYLIGVKQEREACAILCKGLAAWHSEIVTAAYETAADAIRARGQG